MRHHDRRPGQSVLSVITAWSLLAAALLPFASQADEWGPDDVLDRDFKLMMQWFGGRYDNQEQVYFEENQNLDENLRHERIHHIFFPVDIPDVPGTNFYVQQYLNDDPESIYRQRIYAFEPDYTRQAVRLTIYTPKDVKALVNAHETPDKLTGLAPDDLDTRPGCQVYWEREGQQFMGSMVEGACDFVSERSGKRIIISDDLLLNDGEIWIRDVAVDADGNRIFGHPDNIHHKNNKAREFVCWGVISAEETGGDPVFVPDLRVHDQGGTAWFESEGENPVRVGIKIRNVRWPYGRNRDSLVLYAYRDGSDRAESYVWTSPDGTRIALNLRWMQASCTLDEDSWATRAALR